MKAGRDMKRSANGSTPFSGLAMTEAQFPEDVSKIRQLFNADESFRSMCEDLAVAVEALDRVDSLPDNVREVRQDEYRSLVAALVEEIRDAIRLSKVVILKRSTDHET